jgi:hypothetical protein
MPGFRPRFQGVWYQMVLAQILVSFKPVFCGLSKGPYNAAGTMLLTFSPPSIPVCRERAVSVHRQIQLGRGEPSCCPHLQLLAIRSHPPE